MMTKAPAESWPASSAAPVGGVNYPKLVDKDEPGDWANGWYRYLERPTALTARYRADQKH